MELQWPAAREPAAQRVWQQVLVPISAELRAGAADLAQRAVDRMRSELPQLFPDQQTVNENLVSTEASLRQLAHLIEVGGDPRRVELPPSTLAIARAAVPRHVVLADLMRFYRLAQELVWQWIHARITAAVSDPADLAKAIELATGWIFGYVDAALVHAEQAYSEERETWLRGAAAARAAAIDDILAKREHDPQHASKRLRYDVNRQHLGVTAWVEQVPQDGDAQPLLGNVIAEVARAVGADSNVIHPLGSLAVAGWVSRRRPFTQTEVTAAKVGELSGVRLAFGDPDGGLPGFRRTHVQASHARRVASLIGPHGGAVTHYHDVAVAALASADTEHAASFVTRVLGPLAATDEDTYRVASTLAVYLQENRSRARAARRLIVHPNTVSYRVNQAESVLGRRIDSDTLELSVALALLPALPRLAQRHATEL
ncbi:Sugar diacid utilization regulator [Mycobacterium basiliense]|uniref:Sugar diacid utilization regulator n=1 Tax=Mycobacterium basiliense TaxID=2094119 RepID=A0A447GB77_9MYCO|nr:helix-turn-helix domain-containing protein [Mycobacterium basiliense]VDM87724.1 Sugar diacid utilization regulator [Mycobacterium basiliense]